MTSKENLRQLGDPVLAKAGKVVNEFTQESKNELRKQIEIAKKTLTATGGVGIAANQCADIAEPLRFALVGIDYTNPEHATKALERYPNANFLQMIVCINPIVVSASEEEVPFLEGCLSFRGAVRASVSRPKEITVTYQDLEGAYTTKTFQNSDAVVMQHELDHILNGVVFIEKIIKELDQNQIKSLLEIVQSINTPSFSPLVTPALQTPVPIFTRNADGKIVFDVEETHKILSLTQKNALDGLEKLLV